MTKHKPGKDKIRNALASKGYRITGMKQKQRAILLIKLFNLPFEVPETKRQARNIVIKINHDDSILKEFVYKKDKVEKIYSFETKDGFNILLKNNKKITYRQYLKTNHWRSIRNRIMKMFDFKCFDCFEPAQEVHHLTYENLGCEKDEDLIPLCRKCHEYRHNIASKAQLKVI